MNERKGNEYLKLVIVIHIYNSYKYYIYIYRMGERNGELIDDC